MTEKSKSRWLTARLILLVVGLGACAWYFTRDDDGLLPEVVNSPAGQVVQGMIAFYEAAPAFQATSRVTRRELSHDARPMPGSSVSTMNRTLTYGGGNRLKLVSSTGIEIYSDGNTLVVYVEPFQKYLLAEAPDDLIDLRSDEAARLIGGREGTYTLGLAANKSLAALLRGAVAAEDLGLQTLGDQKARQLRFRLSAGRTNTGEQLWRYTEMWIAAEGDPLLLKVVHRVPIAMDRQGKLVYRVFTEEFEEWTFPPSLPATTFAFVAPEGALRFSRLAAVIDPLIARPAPEFTLPLAGGGEVDMASHRGKDVVILDFWAEWCKFCMDELPVVADLAEEFQDHNVVMYAVNVQDEPEVVRQFLETFPTPLTVPMDETGEVGLAYKAYGLPHLVIIDQQGIVQAVHSGFDANQEAQWRQLLRGQLETLLAGKSVHGAIR